MHREPKKAYTRPQGPQLKVIGTVADLTRTGSPGGADDVKQGSVGSPGL